MKGANFNIFSEDFFHKQNLISVLNYFFVYSIIAGACFIKLPQLKKIITKKSAVGLSFMSIYLEIFVATSLIVFSIYERINFILYVDVILINLQNLILVFFMWKYNNIYSKSVQILKVCFYIIFILFTLYLLPKKLVPLLGISSAPLSCFSKLPQIYLNHKNKNTGNLSLLTYTFILSGNLARIFIILFNIKNKIYLINCGLVSFLNCTILFQILYYWKNTTKMLMQADKIKKK
ncbi:conserved Plasmodium protein, unknown function [Plasmodium gaboni]|uniref:Mannose-P-dolichol utilization defect 1 protein homolog n=1 Tax=Plasmodium gaboni TaxID=647221 RepID=A0ABY1UPD7_9APIC|nr:conserved Plasmodium protein, unknown function [Plasmodium gaboni]